MGPRLVGRGKGLPDEAKGHDRPCFNGAASCGTRKEPQEPEPSLADFPLQWGRVLWDAERVGMGDVSGAIWLLQWGRVLWDAESFSA